jgi:lipoprotein-anchoring transpeptidase ErfK/SrfK
MTVSSRIAWPWLCLLLCSFSFLLAFPVSAATTTTKPVPPLDSDGDGLSDSFETQIGTDLYSRDTDADGFDDKTEMFTSWSPTGTRRMLKSVQINLKTQKLEMKVDGIIIKTYPVSTGLPRTPTPKGTFTVLNKNPRAWSKAAKLWMPYWMAFTTRGHGLHELPEWPGGKKEGADHLGHPASHGCIRLGIGAAKDLYEWSPIGTKIYIN